MRDRSAIHLYVAVYDAVVEADADYRAVRDLHAAKAIKSYDAALIERHGDEVVISKHETPTEHGAWVGLVAGGVVGLLFPPSLLAGAVAGATGGGVVAHLRQGLDRSDLERAGTLLESGQAAVVVVSREAFGAEVGGALGRAARSSSTTIDVDVDGLQEAIEAVFRDPTA